MEMDVLLKKEKPAAAAEIRAECFQLSKPELMNATLDYLLDPCKDVDNEEMIDWCRWLIAGGSTPEEFSSTVRRYDKATSCNTIWTADCVAYRCRTCGISQCMSLCTECFHHGNHEGHDFIMFRSETGGACDCGEMNIVKKSGCCSLHCPKGHDLNQTSMQGPSHQHSKLVHNISKDANSNEQTAPPELLCVANVMMPRLFLRLIQHMRLQEPASTLETGSKFIGMLKGMSEMGAPMRQVITHALTNPQIYLNLTEDKKYNEKRLQLNYRRALESIPTLNIPKQFENVLALCNSIEHKTFLEELIFWTAKFEFPEDLICLLLSLRPDNFYKEAFTRAFVLHYGTICQLLVQSPNPELFSTRVVTVSVQIFSVEQLSILMVESMQLLHVIILSLKQMILATTCTGRLKSSNDLPGVVDCNHDILSNMYYASLKSDLNEILSHTCVAVKLLEDDVLLEQWFDLVSMFQRMNPNRKVNSEEEHEEFESSSYISAITAELEICSTIMWAILSHMKDASTANLNKNLLGHCWRRLKKTTECPLGISEKQNQISFHLPLHRSFARFIHQGIWRQGLNIKDVLPPAEELLCTIQPLIELQAAYYEIVGGEWVRNGNHILHQASHYIGSMCCNSTIDADIFLLQISMEVVARDDFLMIVFQEFKLDAALQFLQEMDCSTEMFQEKMKAIENLLNFLAILTSVKTNLGLSEKDLLAIELTTLLCKGDKTHSQLMELMPERCGHGHGSQMKNFETVLEQVADFHAPKFEQGGNMTQGIYTPKSSTWKTLYDPVYVLLRSSQRSDFQTSRDRFTEHLNKTREWKDVGGATNLWPPFRIPSEPPKIFHDSRKLLLSRMVHKTIFVILYESLHFNKISENIIALTIYLLEIALSNYNGKSSNTRENCQSFFGAGKIGNFQFYEDDNLFGNLQMLITGHNHYVHDESILSLLLKLHSNVSGLSNSYSFKELGEQNEDRVGSGTFFIETLIDKIVASNDSCKLEISRLKNLIWPSEKLTLEIINRDAEEKEKAEKRLKAKERKLALISEFAKKRQEFAQVSHFSLEEDYENSAYEKSISPSPEDISFDCVICLQSTKNCEENPIGLVVYLHASKIMENRRDPHRQLKFPFSNNLCKSIHEEKLKEFQKHFDNPSINMTMGASGGGGIFIQTCGHYLHMNCLNSYMSSLYPNEKKPKGNMNFEKRDYRCPLCRKLANSFLPLIKIGISHQSESFDSNCDIAPLFRKRNKLSLNQNLLYSINQFANELKSIYSERIISSNMTDLNSASGYAGLLASVLSFNLELEMSFQEWSCSRRTLTQLQLLPTSSVAAINKSIPFLVNVLKVNYKSLSIGHGRHIAQLWEACVGSRGFRHTREVPLLLRDPCVLLIHFVLQLSNDFPLEVFSKIVQGLYNLTFIQILCNVVLNLGESDRKKILENYQLPPNHLQQYLTKIVSKFESCNIFMESQENVISSVEINSYVIGRMMPFLRLAALTKHHIFQYSTISPLSLLIENEFEHLTQILRLGNSEYISSHKNSFLDCATITADKFLSWSSDSESVISSWCQHLVEYFVECDQPKSLLGMQNICWESPRLIELPREYDELFQYYTKARCQKCQFVPTDPNICLVCGTLICLKSSCCQNPGISEVVKHSMDCGAGTAVFLSTQTSSVTILRGRKACNWGSVYLDSFGEEDPGLKRGKPLFLCLERFLLLEQLWLTHSFDNNTACRWFWHRDFL